MASKLRFVLAVLPREKPPENRVVSLSCSILCAFFRVTSPLSHAALIVRYMYEMWPDP